jgi:O-antigen/teichoic acid export membrane protein
MSWSDTLMLSYYLPEESVGVYRIAFKITTLITFAQFALNTVVTPMIAGLHSGGSGMGHLAKRVATLNLYTAGPIFLLIVLLGPFLIGLFGVESAQKAYPWLLILALGQLANAFAGPVLNVLNMTGYEKSARNTMLVMATVNIALNAFLIPLMGPLGAAIATASTMIGWNLWAGILVYKYHGLITVPFLAKKNSV